MFVISCHYSPTFEYQSTLLGFVTKILHFLPPPTVEIAAAKPKLSFQITHLSEKNTRTPEMKQVEAVVDAVKCNKYYYEVKYPELLAAMMQTKVVSLTKSQGFEFIKYYNSRGNKKQD